jgi:hypothetical protein
MKKYFDDQGAIDYKYTLEHKTYGDIGILSTMVIWFKEPNTIEKKLKIQEWLAEYMVCSLDGRRINDNKTLVIWNIAMYAGCIIKNHKIEFIRYSA